MKPLFLFSLPRSGSTLLQKLLMTHDQIDSIAEPWFLLPLAYMVRKEGVLTEYSHDLLAMAMEDLVANLGGKESFFAHIHDFAIKIYSDLSRKKAPYFLDKTPRYYHIIPEIAAIFPEAKFIFLFRNPVQVYASLMEVRYGSFSRFFLSETDLWQGPKLLAQGYLALREKSFFLRYEDFVRNPEEQLRALCAYLEIDYRDEVLGSYKAQDLKGRLGDPRNIHRYAGVTSDTLEKWKKQFTTPFRKMLIIRYVRSLDSAFFQTAGYDRAEILNDLQRLPVSYRKMIKWPYEDFLKDFWQYSTALLKKRWKGNLREEKYRWTRNRYLS